MNDSFRTGISEVTDGVVNLRGYSLDDVMRTMDSAGGAFLCIFGRLPSPAEKALLNPILNSLLDHGFVASTISAARYVASGNPELVPAVAGGLLAAGSNTVSPQHSFEVLKEAARLRRERSLDFDQAAKEIVSGFRASGRRLPGFGHPTHKHSDFRATTLFEIATDCHAAGPGIKQFEAIHTALHQSSGKQLPINIDGALAAVGYDFGWTVRQTVALAILSVLPGIVAHAIEEIEDGRPLRHIAGTYDVPAIRPLPATERT